MAAPTNTALVKKALANSEPSTHGPQRQQATNKIPIVAIADDMVAKPWHRLDKDFLPFTIKFCRENANARCIAARLRHRGREPLRTHGP